ncbi:unnamed protein product [Protopolystoma xenopodis]|uniref:Uncharacterized protein n=1 Tax=Protopolystoma xenopodis TaxID=117903 RepID=A0A448WTC0_9PLAT|nr:unnamed protein product [Protopolystoma xenopodis]
MFLSPVYSMHISSSVEELSRLSFFKITDDQSADGDEDEDEMPVRQAPSRARVIVNPNVDDIFDLPMPVPLTEQHYSPKEVSLETIVLATFEIRSPCLNEVIESTASSPAFKSNMKYDVRISAEKDNRTEDSSISEIAGPLDEAYQPGTPISEAMPVNTTTPDSEIEFQNMEAFRRHLKARIKAAKRGEQARRNCQISQPVRNHTFKGIHNRILKSDSSRILRPMLSHTGKSTSLQSTKRKNVTETDGISKDSSLTCCVGRKPPQEISQNVKKKYKENCHVYKSEDIGTGLSTSFCCPYSGRKSWLGNSESSSYNGAQKADLDCLPHNSVVQKTVQNSRDARDSFKLAGADTNKGSSTISGNSNSSKERSAAKRERKATKTLAIVLGRLKLIAPILTTLNLYSV